MLHPDRFDQARQGAEWELSRILTIRSRRSRSSATFASRVSDFGTPRGAGSAAFQATHAVWLVLLLTFLATAPLRAEESVQVLDARVYHLGTPGAPEWSDSSKAEAQQVEISFEAERNERGCTLLLRQAGVKLDWAVLLNGKKVGTLITSEQALVHTLTIPPGALRDGKNTLTILSALGGDDIEVSDFRLAMAPAEEAVRGAKVDVLVTDLDTGGGLPCRITIVDESGALAALQAEQGQTLAVRPGVIYTRDGKAKLELLPGNYTMYGTRGFEYGLDSRKIELVSGKQETVELGIRREVPTAGLISSDTHIHTLTYSKHGDATLEERMLTIAGEGIELPIATDHNAHADYSEPATGAGVQSYFTPVMGNEVTTKIGHFNAFPIEPGSPVADFKAETWPQLMRGMRATPGVKVVTLNHPRDEHDKFVPLAPVNFNAISGDVLFSPEFTFDAMEVITSAAMQSDIFQLYRDWFALLNRGYRLTAIASSDTHDVARFILGQARTFVVCDDDDLSHLNVNVACESLLAGRVLVSMGLLTQMTVNDEFGVGDLATHLGETMKVNVTVHGPSWTCADRVELFADGVKIREEAITPGAKIEKASVTWQIPRPGQDVHLVAVATGPGVSAPFCETPRPFQPTSKDFHPRVIGSTNPIWIDADGDGRFTSARAYAEQLIAQTGNAAAKLIPALAKYDEAVAVQAAALCHAGGADIRNSEFTSALKSAAEAVRNGFAAFAATLK